MPYKRMRHALAAAVTAVFLALGAGAQADGPSGRGRIYAPPPPPPPPPFTWTGFYVGGNIGGAWATSTLTDNLNGVSFDTDHSGFIGGGQVGFNYQTSNLVLGVEWDFDWTSIGETGNGVFVPLLGATLQASADTDWVTTLAARVGLTSDRWLVFVKLGGGWVHNSASITNLATGAVASTSDTRGGWLVGAGVEYPFTSHWTAKLEYDFLGLQDRTVTRPLGNTFTFDRDLQMLKIGLNYKF
jgi:outer membrane immunogenic protein